MATTTRNRTSLYSQSRVALILGIGRLTVGDVAPRIGLTWKSASRGSRMLDRRDIERLASVLNAEPDWDACEPN